ncbi:MAG TPA: winged helix-turn-helix domain-containing protein [Trinickia sp.]|nr:winged helix-turn-helix domain-containing protein [Trinickia sp.]
MALLLVDDDIQKKREICDLLSHAGYQVDLGQGSHASPAHPASNDVRKAVTIFQVERGHPLQLCLENLVGFAGRPWRLSLHQRCLVAPNDNSTKLTSLEFTLIKVFATMEKGEIVSRRRITDEFGEHYLSYDQNRLDTTVMRLRKKVKMQLGMALPLNTVRVRGFSFDDWLLLDH